MTRLSRRTSCSRKLQLLRLHKPPSRKPIQVVVRRKNKWAPGAQNNLIRFSSWPGFTHPIFIHRTPRLHCFPRPSISYFRNILRFFRATPYHGGGQHIPSTPSSTNNIKDNSHTALTSSARIYTITPASGTESLGRTFKGEASGRRHDLWSTAGIDYK